MTGNEPPTTDADLTAALTADFSETARALLSVADVHDTLEKVATLAVATIDGCDSADDRRWPEFGREATARGIRSMLACPLFVDGTPGALNLYARYPLAFGVIDRAKAVLLAGLAAVAFSAALNHEEEKRQSSNLHAALATRELIGQAQGILIERERVTPDQAFDILRRASQHLNLKLRDVAQSLVETGERPKTGPSR
jgi:ANTAR domain